MTNISWNTELNCFPKYHSSLRRWWHFGLMASIVAHWNPKNGKKMCSPLPCNGEWISKLQGYFVGFPSGSVVENSPANAGDVRDVGLIPGLGRFHGGGHGYSILAWRIPWTEESGTLQSTSARMQGCIVLKRHWWHSWKEFTFFPVFFFFLI